MKSVAGVSILLIFLAALSFFAGPATPVEFWWEGLRDGKKIVDLVTSQRAIFELRSVHIFLAVCVGFALSTAGRTMQQFIQNPLADPHVVGLSAGSTTSILLTILFFPAFAQEMIAGWLPVLWLSSFLGSVASLILLRLLLFKCVGRWGTPSLALVGMFLNAGLSAVMMIVFARLSPTSLSEVQSWTLGSIQPYGFLQAIVLIPLLILPSLFLISCERPLLLISFGQDFSLANNVNFPLIRSRILFSLGVLCSACVCAAGSVGFVGLLVPHLTRRWIRHPASMWNRPIFNGLMGSSVLLAADLCSRTLTPPTELPVGVYTALLSVPFLFLFLFRGRSSV